MNVDAELTIRALASHLGATREDLARIARTLPESPVPTVAEFAPVAARLLTGRTADTYRHHIDRLVTELGARRLNDVTLLDLEQAAVDVRGEALTRSGARHGYGAQESFVNATRFVFACAIKSGHIRESPAAGLARPRRRRSPRRALSSDELRSLFAVVLATSRDPELDLLILAFARETACRREGILNLGRADLHPTPSVVLYEKFDEQREIPVSAPLLEALEVHARTRADGCDRVFHYSDGTCLTDRRFDTLFSRVGQRLPWVRALGVTLHWIRYSTLTDIRMTAGERVAAAYAGHGDNAGGVTATYTRASFAELQAAHRRLFCPEPEAASPGEGPVAQTASG
ncbi:MAG: tyrosine-type recombinase/integrase [Acidimicrobiales bacterium]